MRHIKWCSGHRSRRYQVGSADKADFGLRRGSQVTVNAV